MSKQELIDALPDLLLLVKRDGTAVARAGGWGVAELGRAAGADRAGFEPAWSESTAQLIRQLVRNALSDRAAVEGRFEERGKHYEVRVNPQGPRISLGLQLDRGWAQSLTADGVARKVCAGGIAMANALGLTPIATGVDGQPQRAALLELGCRFGLGDFYGGAESGLSALAPAAEFA